MGTLASRPCDMDLLSQSSCASLKILRANPGGFSRRKGDVFWIILTPVSIMENELYIMFKKTWYPKVPSEFIPKQLKFGILHCQDSRVVSLIPATYISNLISPFVCIDPFPGLLLALPSNWTNIHWSEELLYANFWIWCLKHPSNVFVRSNRFLQWISRTQNPSHSIEELLGSMDPRKTSLQFPLSSSSVPHKTVLDDYKEGDEDPGGLKPCVS